MRFIMVSCVFALAMSAGRCVASFPEVTEVEPPKGGPRPEIRLLGPLQTHSSSTTPGGGDNRSMQDVTVYDSTHVVHYQTGAPADFVFAGNESDLTDSLTLELPRTGMGPYGRRGFPVSRVTFAISHLNREPNGVYVDVYHFFYDDLVTWSGDSNCIGRTFLGGYSLAGIFLEPCDPATCFNEYTVTNLTDLGIVLEDNFVAFEQVLAISGSDPINPDPNALAVFAGDGTPGGLSGANVVGESTDTYMILGNCYASFGGTPYVANLYLAVGVDYCDSDFDGSGFSDLDDFSAFVQAFEAGC